MSEVSFHRCIAFQLRNEGLNQNITYFGTSDEITVLGNVHKPWLQGTVQKNQTHDTGLGNISWLQEQATKV